MGVPWIGSWENAKYYKRLAPKETCTVAFTDYIDNQISKDNKNKSLVSTTEKKSKPCTYLWRNDAEPMCFNGVCWPSKHFPGWFVCENRGCTLVHQSHVWFKRVTAQAIKRAHESVLSSKTQAIKRAHESVLSSKSTEASNDAETQVTIINPQVEINFQPPDHADAGNETDDTGTETDAETVAWSTFIKMEEETAPNATDALKNFISLPEVDWTKPIPEDNGALMDNGAPMDSCFFE
ncbi:MAG: hypothetical protein ACO33E_03710 [Aquiluna sp.]